MQFVATTNADNLVPNYSFGKYTAVNFKEDNVELLTLK